MLKEYKGITVCPVCKAECTETKDYNRFNRRHPSLCQQRKAIQNEVNNFNKQLANKMQETINREERFDTEVKFSEPNKLKFSR